MIFLSPSSREFAVVAKSLESTYRKYYNNLPLPIHHHGEIIPHLEPAKCLVNEYIPDLGGRYEACCAGEEV